MNSLPHPTPPPPIPMPSAEMPRHPLHFGRKALITKGRHKGLLTTTNTSGLSHKSRCTSGMILASSLPLCGPRQHFDKSPSDFLLVRVDFGHGKNLLTP